MNKNLFLKLGAVGLTIAFLLSGGWAYVNRMTGQPDDNEFEENVVEPVIKHFTGVDQDATPDTPENEREGEDVHTTNQDKSEL